MTLAIITAAIEATAVAQAAAAAHAAAAAQAARTDAQSTTEAADSDAAPAGANNLRHTSSLSETTSAETDPFESDSSAAKAASPATSGALPLTTACVGAIGVETHPPKKRRGSTQQENSAKAPKHEEKESDDGTVLDTYPAEMLLDLAGSTSAEVRRMNEDERALVHYKRRLRNRESAKRSRARRQATICDVQNELEDLKQITSSLLDRCFVFARTNERQAAELETLRKEKGLLESLLRSSDSSL